MSRNLTQEQESEGSFLRFLYGAAAVGTALLTIKATRETLLPKTKFVKIRSPFQSKRIMFLSDFHFRPNSRNSTSCVKSILSSVKKTQPDIIILGGDYIIDWNEASCDLIAHYLAPLAAIGIPVIATLGNHDYYEGSPSQLNNLFQRLDIRLLQNDSVEIDGVTIIGLDSSHQEKHDLTCIPEGNPKQLTIIAWHEPDAVDLLPKGCANLMLSGHTHGGQVLSPWGWGEHGTKNGKKYIRGFFDSTPVPLYVSVGIGTVFPYFRLFAHSEITIIDIIQDPAE